MERIALGFYKYSVWAMRLVYLNLLWIAYSLAGLIIFGIMPATTAMFSVARKWVQQETEIPIYETFWKSYKENFVKTNGIGLIFYATTYLSVTGFIILFNYPHLAYNIASFGFVAIFILLAIVLTYFFPIYVHFNLKTMDYLKWPLIIGVIHPILTIVMIVGISLIYYILFTQLLPLLFFFGGSLAAYLLTLGASQVFYKYEVKNN